MMTKKQSKKDSNLRDLFAKTPAKKQDPTRELGSDPGGGHGDGTVDEDANPVTKAFMEQLFGTLQEDLAAHRQKLATTNELRNIRSLAEAEALPGMDSSLRDSPPAETMDSLRGDQDHQGQAVRQRKKKPPKPSERENKKEREDLLHRLGHQKGPPETGHGT
ncbi:hypothetical protein NDU88_005527 [Pleurodeles waltl]|uniref:Uncharacterized protein n=1 Tax=Pleurodeles waltl TaxID=8319 RepID=A0AAV7TV24_PLEWA|nr:hypothetical protein NDU88_005527 [Pleurodeles waltl]